ncbi:MAG: N-acetyltransferase [Deltaproteobacteria bacterium]|nr:N-acetyltransferase [Deltaproteobacteria bacterium]
MSSVKVESKVKIEPVTHPRDTVRYVKTWWRVFRDDPHWVPPLIFERKSFFDPAKNPYLAHADVQCFLASRDGEDLGTIAATVDHSYQEHEPGVGFFGFFEFVDDLEVARALFDAACDWLRGRGMKKLIGPFNFNTNHEFGLLVDGFDSDPYVANPHNSAYFPPMYEKLGLRKAMDWYAYTIDDPESKESKRIQRVSDRFLSRHPEVRFRNFDMSHFDREIELLHGMYDDAWEHNWAHVKVTREEFFHLARGLKSFLDPGLCFIVEVEGEPAAFSVSLPNVNRVVKTMNGRLFPFGWLRFALGRRNLDSLRIFMLGVKHEYQHLPLGAPLYLNTWNRAIAKGVRSAEASLILESNHRMRSALERMGFGISKTYRNFEFELTPS